MKKIIIGVVICVLIVILTTITFLERKKTTGTNIKVAEVTLS